MNQVTVRDILIHTEKAQPILSDKQILPPLTSDIRAGKMVCLMGLQHSILSAYMRMLAGVDPSTSGLVKLLGSNANQLSPSEKQQLRRNFGFVLREGPLLSVLNGIENIKLAARYHHIGDEDEIEEKTQSLLAEWSFDADQQLLPAYMNRLHRRCLAIARPLILEPLIIFIDSPFDGLDHHDRNIVVDYLNNIVKQKKITIVLSGVDIYFTNRYANQIIFCDNNETLVFNNWQSFYQCQQKNVVLLFQHEHIKKNE